MPASTRRQDLTESQIRLVLPADPGYVRVARTAARGLGERLGMGAAAVEDLCLAVDETLVLLLRPEGSAGDITFVFTMDQGALAVEAASSAGAELPWTDRGALSRFEALVAPVVDELAVSDDPASVRFVKHW